MQQRGGSRRPASSAAVAGGQICQSTHVRTRLFTPRPCLCPGRPAAAPACRGAERGGGGPCCRGAGPGLLVLAAAVHAEQRALLLRDGRPLAPLPQRARATGEAGWLAGCGRPLLALRGHCGPLTALLLAPSKLELALQRYTGPSPRLGLRCAAPLAPQDPLPDFDWNEWLREPLRSLGLADVCPVLLQARAAGATARFPSAGGVLQGPAARTARRGLAGKCCVGQPGFLYASCWGALTLTPPARSRARRALRSATRRATLAGSATAWRCCRGARGATRARAILRAASTLGGRRASLCVSAHHCR